MYLKSIEIQGFKSFANRLVFEFHNGITGIVGPNGSGKSNVADAVRWVLGEQRIKQLRGASMQDVIFAGTELRKPQGFAYVAITLDNRDHQLAIDYEQVTVSRRLYRSGESEYRINGNTCRLKDINELFYDTGIGKEGYSIIGQGQIDRILSGRPEERRELFDEAAGIVKFKRRKAIAQKKLEDEQANLIRVKDILSELEKQVGPLERQSRAAREYLQLKEQLKTGDATLFLMEKKETEGQLQEIERRAGILSGDMAETKKQSENLKGQWEKIENEFSALEQKIGHDNVSFNQKEVEKSSLSGRIDVLKEQIHTEEMHQEHFNHRDAAIEAEMKERAVQLKEHENEMSRMAKEELEAKGRLEEAGKSLSHSQERIRSLEGSIEQAKEALIQSLNQKASLKAKQQRYEAMLEQVNVRRSQVSQKLLLSKSDESVQEEQIAQEKKVLSQLAEEKEQAQLALGQAEEDMEQAERDLHRLTRSLNDIQQEYHTSYTKLESLRNLAERYDGYGGSIRRVMEVRDRVHGIHGVVADLISTEQRYETAIETALGGNIQNIVTDSEATAKHLIEYLKKNKYGRATFLPLTSIGGKGTFPTPQALKEPGVLGLASDLVQTKPQYGELVRYLLGRVAVADTIDHAIALAKKYKYSLRIVTLEGELLSPGGSMTGGAFKNTSNLLGRRRELEELEGRCQKALHRAEAIQKELHLAEGMAQEKKEESKALQEKLQSLKIRETAISVSISKLEDKKAEIAQSSSDLVLEHAQLEEQVREITKSRLHLEEDLGDLEKQRTQEDSHIEEQGALLEQEKRIRDQLSDQLSGLQMEVSKISQRQDFSRQNRTRIQEEYRKLAEEQKGLSSGRNDSQKAVEEKRKEIRLITAKIGALGDEMEGLRADIASKEEKKGELALDRRQLMEKRDGITARLADLDKDMFRLQAQREKLEEKSESAAAYLWAEYEMTPSQAETWKEEGYNSPSQVREVIGQLKNQIRALGNINVNAIEDYREVSERYEFMRDQHEDLVAAREELERIIEELDQGMHRQFKENFARIQSEFNRVFQELFGGGQGALELVEGADILEAGIQIIAQPPGKKLQNMMQLSGGEKALTAISLLFAIQNLKPSPFCLLDEIEAALDDSNVDRFAKYLHKLTKNTQFIVITHRRGTMVAADRLYGITMQEKGVSAQVSVNLIADELEQ